MSPVDPPTDPRAKTAMRQALAALVVFQRDTPTAALPRLDEARLADTLAAFGAVQAWQAADQALWQRIGRRLIDSALAQPVVALQNTGLAGPVTHDLAALLRGVHAPWDETQELDWAVRWWEQARREGLPVDSDFGEFWRAFEWMGLLRHLAQLGAVLAETAASAPPGRVKAQGTVPHLLAHANKVALRYGPLKPLLRLLEPMSGTKVQAGFTF